MNIIDKYLNEWKTISLIRRNKIDKRKALSGRESVYIAKLKDDPLYDKYKKYKDLYMQAKLQLKKKYKMKADIEAKRKIR